MSFFSEAAQPLRSVRLHLPGGRHVRSAAPIDERPAFVCRRLAAVRHLATALDANFSRNSKFEASSLFNYMSSSLTQSKSLSTNDLDWLGTEITNSIEITIMQRLVRFEQGGHTEGDTQNRRALPRSQRGKPNRVSRLSHSAAHSRNMPYPQYS